MEKPKPCHFGNSRCLCQSCQDNAAYDDCEKGYCILCFDCMDHNEQRHDVYICTGYDRRAEDQKLVPDLPQEVFNADL